MERGRLKPIRPCTKAEYEYRITLEPYFNETTIGKVLILIGFSTVFVVKRYREISENQEEDSREELFYASHPPTRQLHALP